MCWLWLYQEKRHLFLVAHYIVCSRKRFVMLKYGFSTRKKTKTPRSQLAKVCTLLHEPLFAPRKGINKLSNTNLQTWFGWHEEKCNAKHIRTTLPPIPPNETRTFAILDISILHGWTWRSNIQSNYSHNRQTHPHCGFHKLSTISLGSFFVLHSHARILREKNKPAPN